jgi:hypothetical protein
MSTTTIAEAVQCWSMDGEVIRLRQWGTDRIHMLPAPSFNAAREGAAGGARHLERLQPCVEIGIGNTTLVAENRFSIVLRKYLERILGWERDCIATVDMALRSIRMAAAHRSALILRGREDLVPIAHALHRHVFGANRPFVVCDPRRTEAEESVRAAANYGSLVEAAEVAIGGSLCVSDRRQPPGLTRLLRRLYDPETQFQLIICSDGDLHRRRDAFLSPPPIEVPPLTGRAHELPRIVEEYALDALHALDAPRKSFTRADRDWVLEHEAQSLSAIERATLRLIALRTSPNVNQAAARLGMAHVSLTRWIRRRKKLPVQTR